MSDKQKHLEFIQAIVSRMGSNLFMLKGWTVTLIVALFTFLSKENNNFVIISFSIILIFWILSGFFLSKERCFKKLYNQVRKKDEKKINFSMNCKRFEKGKNTWFKSTFSVTLVIFYGTLLLITIILATFSNIDKIQINIKLRNNDYKELIYKEPNLRLEKSYLFK